MKITYMKSPVIILFILLAQFSFSQETTLTNDYKKDVIKKLTTLINDFYIYPDIAQKTSEHLNKEYQSGYFDS